MSYAIHTDLLRFPTGRSVGNCRKDAKKLSKSQNIAQHACLDQVAKDNGYAQGWSVAMKKLMEETIQNVRNAPHAMTRDDLAAIAKRHPKITQYGVGLGIASLLVEMQLVDYEEKFQQQRAILMDMLPECNRALAYVSLLEPQSDINARKTRTSYEMKHHAERALAHVLPGAYVSHGAFIIAALFRGFLPQQCGPNSSTVYFNISEESPILHWSGSSDDAIAQALKQRLKVA